ncbi:hypothetical protein KI387_007277 [Taxus chinensis]|uniref:Uncharacterized protein n=1 Tax=Taxus chinensis TaxID=29808 RepID=A0AA38GPF6_TAXCH|nr:hypothetical protein KI387_007277 [Taxus chinensis]
MDSSARSSDATEAMSVRDKVNALLNAAQKGNLDLFKKIAKALDEGQGLAETLAAVKDANGRGALHFSARDGKTEICKYLLEDLNLDVDSRDDDALKHIVSQRSFEPMSLRKLLSYIDGASIPDFPV